MTRNHINGNKIDLSNNKIFIHGTSTEELKIQTNESKQYFQILIYLPSNIDYNKFKFYPKGKRYEILFENDKIYEGSFEKWIKVTENSIGKKYTEINHFIEISGDFTEYNPRIL